MKKLSYEDIGVMVTREMMAMMKDKRLTSEQKIRIFMSIVEEEETGDVVLESFASALKSGYDSVNAQRRKSIESRRKRQKLYLKRKNENAEDSEENLHESTQIYVDKRRHTAQGASLRPSTIYNKTKQNKTKQYNTPKSPEGDCREGTDTTGAGTGGGSGGGRLEGPIATGRGGGGPKPGGNVKQSALALAAEIEGTEAFRRARVNRGELRKCLTSCLKKNSAAEIMAGLRAWEAAWAREGWRYIPGRITDWLYDGKYLEKPREKDAGGGIDYDNVGVKEIV